jgi:hypothetical protein
MKISPGEFDIAFADPPYAGGGAAKLSAHWLQVPFSSIFSVEHAAPRRCPLAATPGVRHIGNHHLPVRGIAWERLRYTRAASIRSLVVTKDLITRSCEFVDRLLSLLRGTAQRSRCSRQTSGSK